MSAVFSLCCGRSVSSQVKDSFQNDEPTEILGKEGVIEGDVTLVYAEYVSFEATGSIYLTGSNNRPKPISREGSLRGSVYLSEREFDEYDTMEMGVPGEGFIKAGEDIVAKNCENLGSTFSGKDTSLINSNARIVRAKEVLTAEDSKVLFVVAKSCVIAKSRIKRLVLGEGVEVGKKSVIDELECNGGVIQEAEVGSIIVKGENAVLNLKDATVTGRVHFKGKGGRIINQNSRILGQVIESEDLAEKAWKELSSNYGVKGLE